MSKLAAHKELARELFQEAVEQLADSMHGVECGIDCFYPITDSYLEWARELLLEEALRANIVVEVERWEDFEEECD